MSDEILATMKEVKLGRKPFFDAVMSGGLLSKRVSKSAKLAIDLGVELVRVESVGELSENCEEKLRAELGAFARDLQAKWNNCGRKTRKMMEKYGSWLKGEFVVKYDSSDEESGRRARPTTPYEKLSSRSKRRASRELSRSQSTQKLVQAATQGAREDKTHDLAYVLKETMASPGRPSKIRRTLREASSRPEIERLSGDGALALNVSLDLTQRGYQILRNKSKDAVKSHIYPAYREVLAAKERCYPSPSAISVTDTSASVTLQGLLDHTTARLAQAHDILSQLDPPADQPGPSNPAPVLGLLDIKWGFDGATGQSVYKQPLREEDRLAEQSLFCTTMVPLRMQLDGREVWRNQKPSSTQLCRPLRLQYAKETTQLSQDERRRVEGEVSQLHPTVLVTPGGRVVNIHHRLHLTMVNGKVVSALSETPTSNCAVCGAKPSELNDIIAARSRPVRTDSYEYGMSTLHAWIRIFECVLHLSYKLDIRKWQARSADDKKAVQKKKLRSSDGSVTKWDL